MPRRRRGVFAVALERDRFVVVSDLVEGARDERRKRFIGLRIRAQCPGGRGNQIRIETRVELFENEDQRASESPARASASRIQPRMRTTVAVPRPS